MNKSLFNESLNYIDPKTISKHIAQKQSLGIRRSALSENKGASSFIKRPVGILVAILLIIAMVGSVIAVPLIIKSKNKYQAAHDQGIPIEEVDDEGNLKFTQITDQGVYDETGEHFDDPKTDIYCKMLNTIDNFNYLDLKMKTNQFFEGETTVEYKIDIDGGRANQICYENGETALETFTKDGFVVLVNHNAKTYNDKYMPVLSREDSPYIPLKDRITTNPEDGIPSHDRRMDITNCPFSSYCIVPQDLTFSYLQNFDKWDIMGETEYLARKCIVIEGTTSPYISEKHGGGSYKMTVDYETGVLMEFEVYGDNGISRYMYVTECAFDAVPVIADFDPNIYTGYKKTNY